MLMGLTCGRLGRLVVVRPLSRQILDRDHVENRVHHLIKEFGVCRRLDKDIVAVEIVPSGVSKFSSGIEGGQNVLSTRGGRAYRSEGVSSTN